MGTFLLSVILLNIYKSSIWPSCITRKPTWDEYLNVPTSLQLHIRHDTAYPNTLTETVIV